MIDQNDKTSINITVRLFGPFKQIVGERDIIFNLSAGSTVSHLLTVLITKYPSLKDLLFDTNSLKLYDYIVILKDGRNIKIYDNLETKLSDNEVIAIFPPVAGG